MQCSAWMSMGTNTYSTEESKYTYILIWCKLPCTNTQYTVAESILLHGLWANLLSGSGIRDPSLCHMPCCSVWFHFSAVHSVIHVKPSTGDIDISDPIPHGHTLQLTGIKQSVLHMSSLWPQLYMLLLSNTSKDLTEFYLPTYPAALTLNGVCKPKDLFWLTSESTLW